MKYYSFLVGFYHRYDSLEEVKEQLRREELESGLRYTLWKSDKSFYQELDG